MTDMPKTLCSERIAGRAYGHPEGMVCGNCDPRTIDQMETIELINKGFEMLIPTIADKFTKGIEERTMLAKLFKGQAKQISMLIDEVDALKARKWWQRL